MIGAALARPGSGSKPGAAKLTSRTSRQRSWYLAPPLGRPRLRDAAASRKVAATGGSFGVACWTGSLPALYLARPVTAA